MAVVSANGTDITGEKGSTAFRWFHNAPQFHVYMEFSQQQHAEYGMALGIRAWIRWWLAYDGYDPHGIRQYMPNYRKGLQPTSYYEYPFVVICPNGAEDLNKEGFMNEIHSLCGGHIDWNTLTDRVACLARMSEAPGAGARPDYSEWGGWLHTTNIPISAIDGKSILVYGGCPADTCDNNELESATGFWNAYGYSNKPTKIGPIFRVNFKEGTFYVPPKNFYFTTCDCCTGETVGTKMHWTHGTSFDKEIIRARLVTARKVDGKYVRSSPASPFITVEPDKLTLQDSKEASKDITGMFYLNNSLFASQYKYNADNPTDPANAKKFRIQRGTPYFIDAYIDDNTGTGFKDGDADLDRSSDKGKNNFTFFVGSDMGSNPTGAGAQYSSADMLKYIDNVFNGYTDADGNVVEGYISKVTNAGITSLTANNNEMIRDCIDGLKKLCTNATSPEDKIPPMESKNVSTESLDEMIRNKLTPLLTESMNSETIAHNNDIAAKEGELLTRLKNSFYSIGKATQTATYNNYLTSFAKYIITAANKFTSYVTLDDDGNIVIDNERPLALTDYYQDPDYDVTADKTKLYKYVINKNDPVIDNLAAILVNMMSVQTGTTKPSATDKAYILKTIYNDTNILINETEGLNGERIGQLGKPYFSNYMSLVAPIYNGIFQPKSGGYLSETDSAIATDYRELVADLYKYLYFNGGSTTYVPSNDMAISIVYNIYTYSRALYDSYLDIFRRYYSISDQLMDLRDYMLSTKATMLDVMNVPAEDPKPADLNHTYSLFLKYTDFSTLNINISTGVNRGYALDKSICYSIVKGHRSDNLYGTGDLSGVYDFIQDEWLDNNGFTLMNGSNPATDQYSVVVPAGNSTEIPDGESTSGITDNKPTIYAGLFTNLDQDRVYEIHAWVRYPNRTGDDAKYGTYPMKVGADTKRINKDMVNETGERDTEEVFYVKTLKLGATTALGDATIHQHYLLTKWKCDVIAINDLTQFAAKRNNGKYLSIATVLGDVNPSHIPVVRYIINNRDEHGTIPHVDFYFVGAGAGVRPPLVHDGGTEIGCSFIHCDTPTNDSILNIPTDPGPKDSLYENKSYYTYNTQFEKRKTADEEDYLHGYNGWSYGDYNAVYHTSKMLEHDPALAKNPDWIYVPTSINKMILISYWCEHWTWYDIICALTDGHNVSHSTVTARTSFPYIWLYDKKTDQYYKAMPMVFDNKLKKYRLLAGYTYDKLPASDDTHYKEFYGELPVYDDQGDDEHWKEKQTNELP